jgi:hypothetical protein
MNRIVYVALDFGSKDGYVCSCTTHNTLELAKEAIHFRAQVDADGQDNTPIEWLPIYSGDDYNAEIVYYLPKGRYEGWHEIYVTRLNDRY